MTKLSNGKKDPTEISQNEWGRNQSVSDSK